MEPVGGFTVQPVQKQASKDLRHNPAHSYTVVIWEENISIIIQTAQGIISHVHIKYII